MCPKPLYGIANVFIPSIYNGWFLTFGSPVIELSIEGKKIEFLLDTGFNGHIMLPKFIIKELSLEQIGISDYLTASGEEKLIS